MINLNNEKKGNIRTKTGASKIIKKALKMAASIINAALQVWNQTLWEGFSPEVFLFYIMYTPEGDFAKA